MPSPSGPAAAGSRPPRAETKERSRLAPPPPPPPSKSFAELLARCGLGSDPAPVGQARPRARPEREEMAAPRAAIAEPPAWSLELAAAASRPDPAPSSAGPVQTAPASYPSPAAELQSLADQMLRRATVVELPAEVALQLELEVPHLRQVGVELRLGSGRLRASLQAADRAGFERLRAAAPALDEALQRRGLDADRVEVTLQPR